MAKRQRTDSAASYSANEESDPKDGCSKYVQFDETLHRKPLIRCALAPHSKSVPFYTLEEYNIHYAKFHSNRCRECHKNLPSDHFLLLHISENHDPIVEARRARGEKTYACFVEGCDKVCLDPRKRRMHSVDKHFFPRNFDFFIVNDGVDPRRNGSMLRPTSRRKAQTVSSNGSSTLSSTAIRGTGQSFQGRRNVHSESGERQVSDSDDHDGDDDQDSDRPEDEDLDDDSADEDEDADGDRDSNRPPESTNTEFVHNPREDAKARLESADLADLTSSMSALKFVPPSVRFGRGTRSGFAKR